MSRPSVSLKSRNWESKRRGSKGCLILLTSIAIFATCALVLLYATSDEMMERNGERQSPPSPLKASSLTNSLHIMMPSLELANEQNFTNTIKHCTSADVHRCNQHLPDTANPKLQRIAFISTGGKAAEKLYGIVRKALLIYYGNDESVLDRRFDFVSTTHVPPLGYGKSHGWTKIIRVMYSPLLTETVEAMEASGAKIEMNSKSSKDLVSNGMRQIIRFHCRLSQVAMHTSVNNIDLSSDMLLHQVVKAIEIITAEPGDHAMKRGFRQTDRYEKIENYLKDALSEPLSTTSMELKSKMLRNDLEMLQVVLQDELDSTNGLTKWPCKNLWDIDNIEKDNILSTTAAKLAPDCNAPFTTCTIKRDRCEMNGDAKCK